LEFIGVRVFVKEKIIGKEQEGAFIEIDVKSGEQSGYNDETECKR